MDKVNLKKDLLCKYVVKSAKPFSLLIVILLVIIQVINVFNHPIWHDQAVFAAAAKNIVFGKGYALSNFDKLVPFSPGISTGPVVIFPAALAIAVFGNTYWAPNLACVLLIDLILLFIFFAFKRLIKDAEKYWLVFGLFVFTGLFLTVADIGYPSFYGYIWYSLMGDIPSGLFIILAVLYIAEDRMNYRTLFMGGGIAAMGVLCKLQALIGAGVIGICIISSHVDYANSRLLYFKTAIERGVYYGSGLLLPLIAFEIYKMTMLGSFQSYIETIKLLLHMTKASSLQGDSRGAVIYFKIFSLGSHFVCFGEGLTVLSLITGIAIFMGGGVALFNYPKKQIINVFSKLDNPLEWAIRALLWSGIIHILWWIFICIFAMPRYATQGILYFSIVISLSLVVLYQKDAFRGSLFSVIIVIFLLVMRWDVSAGVIESLKKDGDLKDQNQVLRILTDEKEKSPQTVIFSCGVAFEMEYLLKTTLNIVYCKKMFEPEYKDKPKILLSHTLFKDKGLLYFPENSITAKNVENEEDVRRLCPVDDMYASPIYYVARCHEPGQ